METRAHVHEETFETSPEELFALLHTPSAIRGWWGASRAVVVPEKGGIWAAAWGDDEDAPDYVSAARLLEFDAPRRLTMGEQSYVSKEGPLPFEAEFVTTFTVEPADGGATLRVHQDGFPADSEADDFYAACDTGWKDTFAGIRSFLES